MSESQVQSIVHLVSSSVEGLSSDSVTVVDSSGKILAKSGEGMNFGEGWKPAEMERDLENRITQIIERVVGQGKASVQVAAELDYTQSELFQETYDGGPAQEGNPLRNQRHQWRRAGASRARVQTLWVDRLKRVSLPARAATDVPRKQQITIEQNNQAGSCSGSSPQAHDGSSLGWCSHPR